VITIVSGLPRSGTSLMMQMLAAGGMPVLTDGERQADADNPRGYYEWEAVKRLPQEPDLIAQAEDKAVKVISQLLFSLPPGRSYQIIFMDRPLAEVVTSQAEMIRRRATVGAALSLAQLIAALQAHKNQVDAWLKVRQNLRVCRVSYPQLSREARAIAELVKEFVRSPLDTNAMAAQVDPLLYRQRSPAQS